jgi:hypothetical protein
VEVGDRAGAGVEQVEVPDLDVQAEIEFAGELDLPRRTRHRVPQAASAPPVPATNVEQRTTRSVSTRRIVRMALFPVDGLQRRIDDKLGKTAST